MASAEEFIIRLQQQVDGPADAATAALNKLESQIMREQAALGGLESKLGSAKDKLAQLQEGFGGKVDISAVQRAQEKIAELQGKIGEKSGGLDKLKAAMGDFNKVAPEAASGAEDTRGALQRMSEAAEGADGATGKLKAAMGALGPEGQAIVAIITAVIAVVTAAGVALYQLAAAAVSISQQKDGLEATFKALSTGSESGRELVDSLSDVAATLPFAEGKVLAWGKSLMSAGIEGQGLAVAVKAAAAATAIMGDEGGAALIAMEKQLSAGGAAADSLIKVVQAGGKKAAVQLAAMGVQADDLARALGVTPEKMKAMKLTAEQLSGALEKALIEKGAGAMETMGLTWDSIKGKLADGAEDLFEDMGAAVQPFMREVRSLFSEFFAGSTTMSTAKDAITAVLTEVFSVATKVVNFLHKGFLEIEIAAFKVVAALWPIIAVIVAIASNATVLSVMGTVLEGIGIAILVVVGVFAVMFATMTAVIGFFGLMVGAVVSAAAFIIGGFISIEDALFNSPAAVREALVQWATEAYAGAANFVNGIVNGITNGVSAVVGAVKGLASSAMSAFTGFFKIHSPSQLMADTSIHIPGGIVEGVQAGTPDVKAAMEDMGTAGVNASNKGLAKNGGAEGVTSGGAAGRGSSRGGDIYQITVEYAGKREDNPDLVTQLLSLLEQARGLAPRTT